MDARPSVGLRPCCVCGPPACQSRGHEVGAHAFGAAQALALLHLGWLSVCHGPQITLRCLRADRQKWRVQIAMTGCMPRQDWRRSAVCRKVSLRIIGLSTTHSSRMHSRPPRPSQWYDGMMDAVPWRKWGALSGARNLQPKVSSI